MKEYCIAIPELSETSDPQQSARAYISSKLRNREPLTENETVLAAYLIDGEVKPISPKRAKGRPTRTKDLRKLDKHEGRDMLIAGEYAELYEPGASDSAVMSLEDKYGLDFSSVKKAVSRGRDLLDGRSDNVMTFITLVESK